MNPRVLDVAAQPGYTLRLTFTNGEVKVFDVSPLLDKGVFRELRDASLFQSVRPWRGTIQWSGGQDICPDTLYEESAPAGNGSRPKPRKTSASTVRSGKKAPTGRARTSA